MDSIVSQWTGFMVFAIWTLTPCMTPQWIATTSTIFNDTFPFITTSGHFPCWCHCTPRRRCRRRARTKYLQWNHDDVSLQLSFFEARNQRRCTLMFTFGTLACYHLGYQRLVWISRVGWIVWFWMETERRYDTIKLWERTGLLLDLTRTSQTTNTSNSEITSA